MEHFGCDEPADVNIMKTRAERRSQLPYNAKAHRRTERPGGALARGHSATAGPGLYFLALNVIVLVAVPGLPPTGVKAIFTFTVTFPFLARIFFSALLSLILS